MKDTMSVLRMACYDLLNDQLSFNGMPVPVYDKKRRVNDRRVNLYVILSSQRENDDPQTFETFVTNSEIDIEVWQTTHFETSEDPVDIISQQILQAIMPNPVNNGYATQEGFQILNVRRVSSAVDYEGVTNTETVIRKTITISSQIVQQNP